MAEGFLERATELALRIARRSRAEGLRLLGQKLPSETSYPEDFSADDRALCEYVKPYTMTSPERILALRDAVRFVVARGLPGAFLECGVWRGGSMMVVARTLLELGEERDLYLCDTFEGMTEPTAADETFAGAKATEVWEARAPGAQMSEWCHAGREDVQANMARTGYPKERLHFVEGPVEETLPAGAPDQIALLRLDTDWYESTRHELEHLYPRLVPGGPLVIDDYGHWQGARRAVDEFLAQGGRPLYLHRIDYTGRILFKPE